MKGQTSTSALKRFMNKDNTVGHVFAFPFIFGFVCFSLIPVCISFYYAFTNYSLGSKTAAFIGFKNFLRLFQDEVFLKSLAIPKDLDEAATIDGCSKYQIYSRIILPLMKPSIVTTVIIQFYWKWDDYMGPLLYLSRPQSYTVSIAIKLFADSASTTDYGAMFAMSTLSLIPVFLIFLFFNRYLVQGIGTSGLKG